MRKIIVCLAIATLTTAGYLVYKTNETVVNKGLVFGVIEALAQGEGGGSVHCSVTCSNGVQISCDSTPCSAGEWYVECNGKKTSC